jgi:arginase family enzyme
VTCQGVLGGFDHARSGVVWIDAHADFNTPETAASGFFPGHLDGTIHRTKADAEAAEEFERVTH